jgi:hypothetical protein
MMIKVKDFELYIMTEEDTLNHLLYIVEPAPDGVIIFRDIDNKIRMIRWSDGSYTRYHKQNDIQNGKNLEL